MNIDIQLIPSLLNPGMISERVVVVMDVLRATSVIIHALSQGASEIIPVSTVEEAFRLSHHGNKLIHLGNGDDLPFCAQTGITHIVPIFREGVIR